MKLGKNLIVILLLLVALVLVNYLASAIPQRLDLTAGRIYTLSPGSKSLLAKLEEPMVIDFYFSRSARSIPVAFKNYGERIEEMLRQYVRSSGGRLTLNVIDPRPDTPEEEKASAAGLASIAVAAGTERFFVGLVVTQADHRKSLEALTPNREQFLEYDVSKLIYEVQQLDRKRLGLLTSLPLRAPPPTPMQPQRQASQVVVQEWESTYEIVVINPTEQVLPENLDVLAIIHPQGVSDRLQFAIDQFILAGRPVLIAVDPNSLIFESQGGMEMASPSLSSNLPRLLTAYGVAYDPTKVVGDRKSTLAPVDPQTRASQVNPVFISIPAANINAQSQATGQLRNGSGLWFIKPGSVAPIANVGTTFTPLAQTSPEAGEIDQTALMLAEPPQIGGRLARLGIRTVAALVTGKFRTAFPDGPPAIPPPPEGVPAQPPPPVPASPLRESTTTSAIVVVADSDWLLDYFTVERQNFMGTVRYVQQPNNNLDLASNLLEFLGGSQDLISLRGKGPSIRPFHVIKAMETEANQEYEAKLTAVNRQIDELREKLAELDRQNVSRNQLVASPQEEALIESYRKQTADFQRQRRELSLALREDVAALQKRLLATNLLATPLLVCAFGLWFHRRRRR